jgi:hypothetical protein
MMDQFNLLLLYKNKHARRKMLYNDFMKALHGKSIIER